MTATTRALGNGRAYPLIFGGLILAAWIALAIGGASLHMHPPNHGALTEAITEGHHHHASVAPAPVVPPFSFVQFFFVWLLMTVAMILPGHLLIVNQFRRNTSHHQNAHWLVASQVLGYLVMWFIFGVLAVLGDQIIHAAVERFSITSNITAQIPALAVLFAGSYQLLPSKRMCLAQCRASTLPAVEHETEQPTITAALQHGVRHGLACVGSCWALMMLMFAFSATHMHLVWMAVLATVMTVEKTSRHGWMIARLVGVALVCIGALALAGVLPLTGLV